MSGHSEGGSRPSSRFGKEHSRPRQSDFNFGELAGLGIDLNRPTMLLDNDVVTDGEPKPRALSGRFRREEWIEHLLLHFSRNAGAVVADPNFDPVTEILGRGSESGLVVASLRLRFALRRRVKTV